MPFLCPRCFVTGSCLQGAPVGREVPEHLDKRVREGVQVHVELAHCEGNDQVSSIVSRSLGVGRGLTLGIVLGVRVGGLVVMYHLDDLQQIVLVQLLQTIGKLVHVDLYSMLDLKIK